MDDSARLIKKIYEKTSNGEMNWSVGGRNGMFVLTFSSGSVGIEALGRDTDEDGCEFFIYNKEGLAVERIKDTDLDLQIEAPPAGNSWRRTLINLYLRAKRDALGAPKIISEIMNEIEADEIPF